MSADAHMLQDVGSGNRPATIRCYTWLKASVTYGRLQSEDAVQSAYPDLPRYRRPTGGRAVVHGEDLTIAVCSTPEFLIHIHESRAETNSVHITYLRLVDPVRQTLAEFGMETMMGALPSQKGEGTPHPAAAEDCFGTTAKCDVSDANSGKKIMGSAMRRTSKAILLQMSLLPIRGIDVTGDAFMASLRRHYATR